jgi:beta-lactamase class D/beta-lactamase class D OXA-1
MNKLFFLLALLISLPTFAAPIDFPHYFGDIYGCFVLYDLKKDRMVTRYDYVRSRKRISPHATFDIPLSLMAFDQHLITQNTRFKWDGKHRTLVAWNKDQTPQSWLQHSTLWVSEDLISKIGFKKIEDYLHQFSYGNENFSQNSDASDFTQETMGRSHLKISALEQLNFLKKLAKEELPVSKDAMMNTKANMFLKTTPHGWKLYGKTGVGYIEPRFAHSGPQPQNGWFMGFIEKNDERYVFVLNITDRDPPATHDLSGDLRAQALGEELLKKLGVY